MKDIQEVFNRLQERKEERKKLQSVYRDMLSNNQTYQDVQDQMKELRDLKKSIEYETQAEMGADYDQLEDLKQHITSDQEMLSDIALSQYMNGEEIKLVDAQDQEYEPVVKVGFKKVT